MSSPALTRPELRLVLPPRLAERALAAAGGDGWQALLAAVAVARRILDEQAQAGA